MSVFTLGLLIVGAIVLHKDNSSSFSGDGYIISTNTKKTSKYYFSANTKYKNNADGDVTFKNTNSDSVVVSTDNFVHYSDGSVGYLKRGALVNVDDISSSIISYYNVNSSNLIQHRSGGYTVKSGDKDINFPAFIGRISENKYIVAGNNITLQVPNDDKKISGDYFEILYIEDGIVRIDNQEASYQVTAQDTYINIGNNVIINLGNKKISYNGDVRMLLSQITINGDENIDLDDVTDTKDGGGSGDGNGNSDGTSETDSKSGENTDTTNTTNTTVGGAGNGETGNGNESSDNLNNDKNGNNPGTGTGVASNNDVQVELIEAKLTSTTIDASFQLNNSSSINGDLIASITNVLTGEIEYNIPIDKVNGTFFVRKQSLSPSTEYNVLIYEKSGASSKQYFQKVFKTDDLGVTLEKEYATSHSLAYNVTFNSNSEVSRVRLVITPNDGDELENTYFEISKSDISGIREFTNLSSNMSYSVSIDAIWINNIVYSNVYNVNRIDSTLKETPSLSGVTVTANSEEIKFNVKLGEINDPDKAILSYVYEVYLADDIALNVEELAPVYTVSKNDSDDLILDLNQIEELKTGVDYRLRVLLQYNDNEMIREVASDYSANFLIKSKANFTFTQSTATMNKVTGSLKLVDANCSVPIRGRSCKSENNTLLLRYYKLGEDENNQNEKEISLNSSSLSSNVSFENLSSDTTYVVKVYGNYYDDSNVLHEGVQLGDLFYIKTDESEDLKFKVIGDNISGTNKDGTANSSNVVTFDAMLSKPQDSTIDEEISSITMNLYSGSYNTIDKLIGTVTIDDKNKILDFFSSYTITNNMFINSELSYLDSLRKMITVTNNSTNSLNQAYTVEIAKVLDSTGLNEIYVEDNVYTFRLTPDYYLDSRIATYPNEKYINVTTIKKEQLNDEEYNELSRSVSNFDELNDSTIVGVTIENSLSDAFVDSAYIYEKVIVDYVIYNTTTNKEVKRVSVDMGNKYQPKQQTVYLDDVENDDGEHFTRGYNYKISYELKFITEKGDNPVYTNNKLVYNTSIDRQMAIYSQYISTSTESSITYRYTISDIDKSLSNRKLYYTVEGENGYNEVENGLTIGDEYHDIEIPMVTRGNYSIYLKKKSTSGGDSYVEINKYRFESEYNYNNNQLFNLVNDGDNLLKIRLVDDDITNRAVAYKVVIKDQSGTLNDYVRYFLASQLNTVKVDTGEVDENDNPIQRDEKYIYIDYAAINKYMKHDLIVNVYDYYDSGLIGLNQNFENGLILENIVKKKYLNIYNAGVNDRTTNSEADTINGMYFLKNAYEKDDTNMFLYNYLQNTANYKPLDGASYYVEVPNSVGINYNLSFTNNGIIFNDGSKDFSGYNPKVLKVAHLQTSNNNYKFNSITPKVSLDATGSTINSLSLKVNTTGVYGQFVKDGVEHNKFYLEIYSDEELTDKKTTLISDVTVSDNTAVSDVVSYDNLSPDTTYYVLIYAYLDGKYTRLYDKDSRGYVVKTYTAKTLNANGILDKITYSVIPVSYNGESSNKDLTWKLKLKSTSNYKIRFELFDKESNPVNFNGTNAVSCNKNSFGTSNNGFVNGCYIQVGKDDVSNINNVDQVYTFTGNDFVFGGEYYKLFVYAVPYTNGSYDEEHKLILYENDSLSTTGNKIISGGVSYNIVIPTLEEAAFNLNNTLVSGYRDGDGYYVEFVPTISDPYYVMKYGKYMVQLKDEKGTVISSREVSASVIGNNIIKFNNLSANTLYYVELSYETYRNNNGYTESQKQETTPFTDFIYTPIDAGITLGTITAQQNGNQKIILTYNGASNMISNIVRVRYTVSLKGGSSKANGEYSLDNSTNIFTTTSDKTPRLTLDLALSNDTSFTLRTGNTYIISTQYWYMVGNEEVQLTDRANGNTTFTTILNL